MQLLLAHQQMGTDSLCVKARKAVCKVLFKHLCRRVDVVAC
jgi:hypothetical protein